VKLSLRCAMKTCGVAEWRFSSTHS